MGFFTARGVRLHFQDTGSGLPVLLLHAFALSGRMFDAQVAALCGQARLIVPDARGFGESSLGEGPSTMDAMAEDALLLLDHLGIGSAVVGGVSMGGYAALALLRRDPGRVQGLLLADTQAGADDAQALALRESTAQDVLRLGMAVLIERQLPHLLSAHAPGSVPERVAALMRANSPAGAAAALRGMALRADSRDMLARFEGPVLVVVGEDDVLTPPEKARAMAELASQAVLVEIPRAGHLANLEAPDLFNQCVRQFLEQRFGAESAA